MTEPLEDAARASAARFRGRLGSSLNTLMAAADMGNVGIGRSVTGLGFSAAPSGAALSADRVRGIASHAAPGGNVDAPAYRGLAGTGNVDSWMRFAQASREEGGLGLDRAQASGVVANLMHESGPGVAPVGVTGDHGTAHGAAQWRHERYAALIHRSREWGLDPNSTAAQQRFMRWELDNTERGADAAVRAARTPEEAAHAFNRHYERSADPGAGRRATARRLYDHHGN